MLRSASRSVLRAALRQVGRVPVTRRALHRLSVASRGAGIAFLRCRRLVPDTAVGRAHPDRKKGSAMTPGELERELVAALRSLRFVHMGEALHHLEGDRRLDVGMGVLTFDESFATTAELALPVCRKLGVPVTLFVTTGHLDGATTLWDQEVHRVVDEAAPEPLVVDWIDRVLRTDTAKARAAAVRRMLISLASLDEERLQRRLQELRVRVGGRPSLHAVDRMLTSSELLELCKSPLVSIGAHGHHHWALSAVSDEALRDELVQPRTLLRELCGDAFVDVVSYPFGRPPWVDDRAIHAARAAGYRAGFTAEPGLARPGDHLFHLPRLPIGPNTSGVQGLELQGTLEAVDEILLAATGDKARAPEG